MSENSESAIVEETQVSEEPAKAEDVNQEYDIEEPEDDFEFDPENGTNNLNVPQVDNEESGDDKQNQTKDKTQPQAPEKSPKEPRKQAEPETEQISDELKGRAKEAGLSEKDIEGFSSDQLEKVLSFVKPDTKDKEPETKEKDDDSQVDGDFKVELDPDLYDPDICKAINSTANQINTINAKLNEISTAIVKQSELAFEREFEGMITSLGDDFSDTLGEGNIDKIGADSDFFKNRCKVIEEMNAIATGYRQTGKKIPSQKHLFDRAVNSLFGDKIKTNARKQVAAQLDKRSSQIISRPTSKNGKDTLTPEKRATNIVNQKLREFGAFEETEIDEDF
ncbi:MAG: hypothetical protein JW912_07615 [Sedimentisphaerales bacterium]|nr:hypothetical protein [Sedimentisphaerales bacterium]